MGGHHRWVLEDICCLKEEDQVLTVVSKLASPLNYNEYLRAVNNKDGAFFRRAVALSVQRPATVIRNPKGCNFLMSAIGEQEEVEGLYNHTIGLLI